LYHLLLVRDVERHVLNVGIMTDCDAVAIVMHKAGGLAFFDCATVAPYAKVLVFAHHSLFKALRIFV
jgi:selenocysteine lyase/cysteine desulfurase